MARKSKQNSETIRIDIGCGKNKKEGFIGVDQYAIPGVDVVVNLVEPNEGYISKTKNGVAAQIPLTRFKRWPWADNSVEEVHCSHFIEHLTAVERVFFMNELHRVMKPGAKATIIAPHWCSNRAYGDMTHQWPPVAEMWFYYLSKEWRDKEVPHTDIKYNKDGYSCDFEATWGYSMHPAIMARNQEFQQDALQFKKEAAQDIVATLVKK